MRMLVLALALLPAAAIAEERDPPRPTVPARFADECRNAETHRADSAPKAVKPRALAQEPAANLYLGVVRLEDGCDKPVQIRDAIGDDAGDQR